MQNSPPLDAESTEVPDSWIVTELGKMRRSISSKYADGVVFHDDNNPDVLDLALAYRAILDVEQDIRSRLLLPQAGVAPRWVQTAMVQNRLNKL